MVMRKILSHWASAQAEWRWLLLAVMRSKQPSAIPRVLAHSEHKCKAPCPAFKVHQKYNLLKRKKEKSHFITIRKLDNVSCVVKKHRGNTQRQCEATFMCFKCRQVTQRFNFAVNPQHLFTSDLGGAMFAMFRSASSSSSTLGEWTCGATQGLAYILQRSQWFPVFSSGRACFWRRLHGSAALASFARAEVNVEYWRFVWSWHESIYTLLYQ